MGNSAITYIPLDKISVKGNIRTSYDEVKINELSASIRKKGLLQPITVAPNMLAGFNIIFGHRRFFAYKQLVEKSTKKYAEIPCIVRNDVEETEIVELQLIENIQRENITAIEFKNSLVALKSRGLSHKEIAKNIGKTLGYVKNLFSAIKTINENSDLEALIKENEKITMSDIRELKGLTVREQMRIMKLRASGVLGSVKQVREEVKIVNQKDEERRNSGKYKRMGAQEIYKKLYIKGNDLIILPGKISLVETEEEKLGEITGYLRTLADKISG